MTEFQWWALQDFWDEAPYSVMALDPKDGLPRRFVPGEGLVDWPSLSMFVFNGEPGAHPITEDVAIQMMNQGVGTIDPSFVAAARGKAPTLQPPAGVDAGPQR